MTTLPTTTSTLSTTSTLYVEEVFQMTTLGYPHIANPEHYTFVMSEDYEVIHRSGACHWHGLGFYRDCNSSGVGWGNPAQAQADAFYCLHRADGLTHEEAMASLVNMQHFGSIILPVVATEHA